MSGPTLGNLLPSVREAERWNAERRLPFQVAPYEPGDPVTWHVPMADLDRSQYQTWGERWDAFLKEAVGPVVAPIATALPLAIPTIAGLGALWADRSAQAVSLPYRMQQEYGDDWYAASRDPGMAAEGLNVAGMLTLGTLAGATRQAATPRLGEVSTASRSANYVAGPDQPMYDPVYDPALVAGHQTFDEVYPNGVQTDTVGRPLFDVDGAPIHPDATIVGIASSRAPARGTTPDEFADIGTRTVGRRPLVLPRYAIEGDSGRFAPEFGENGEYLRRGYLASADDLGPEQRPRVDAHEVSHAIDLTANPPANLAAFRAGNWGIRPDDPDGVLEDQLHRIYRDLNNDPAAPRQTILGPLDLDYTKTEVAAELWTEAIRAYGADRAYINAVAPDVALAIRQHVRNDPFLSRIIHFNAGGVPILTAPIPETLQGVTLPGGAPIASLGDLMAMGPTPAIRAPLGPQWAADYHAAYQDPGTPQYAARLAQEEADRAARLEAARREAEERAIREGRIVIY